MAVANKKVQAKPKKTSPAANKASKPAARKAVKTKPREKAAVKASRPKGKGAPRTAQAKPATKKIAAKEKPAGKKTMAPKTAVPKTRKVPAAAVKKKPVAQKKTVAKKPARKVAASKKPAATVSTALDRIRALKGMLIAKRDSILKEAKEEIAKYISGENRQLVDTAIDEGDWAVVDISEDLNLRRLDSHRKLLLDIDECLRKIREGTYGVCEECGEEISQKRLNVIPTATLCIDCKENKEKMEALEQTIEI